MADSTNIASNGASPIARSDNTGATIVEANRRGRDLRSRLERGKTARNGDNEGWYGV